MKKSIFYVISIICVIIFSYNDTKAVKPLFATPSHPILTNISMDYYCSIDNQLSAVRSYIYSMAQGSYDEDSEPRWLNHYYDYVHSNQNGGGYLYTIRWDSAKQWAHDNVTQDNAIYLGSGVHTWEGAIKNYQDNNISTAFKQLGHILHLIQDMCVPTHTRNDTHIWGSIGIDGSYIVPEYENWVYGMMTGIDAITKMLDNNSILEFDSLDKYFDELSNYTQRTFYSGDSLTGTVFSMNYSENGTPFPIVDHYGYDTYNGDIFYFAFGTDNGAPYHLAYRYRNPRTNWQVWSAEHPLVYQDTWQRAGKLAMRATAGVVKLFLKTSEKVVVNFDSLPAWVADDGMSSANVSGAPLAAYLGSFGITYTESQTLQVGAEYFLGASSGQNMLTVVAPGSYVSGGSTVGTFTLYFSQPVTSLSFVKIGMGGPHAGNVGVAQWTATAYSALNEVTGSASRPYEWNPSQETIALAGSEIDHVTFTSDWGPSRAGTLLWIDDLTFTPVP